MLGEFRHGVVRAAVGDELVRQIAFMRNRAAGVVVDRAAVRILAEGMRAVRICTGVGTGQFLTQAAVRGVSGDALDEAVGAGESAG
jgi:hypothetical protein